VFDPRVKQAIDSLQTSLPGVTIFQSFRLFLIFWLAKTLAPAVIVSNDSVIIKKLVEAAGTLNDVHSICNVNADEYKMMKSLYDPNDTPNLRGDILKYGRGAFVAVELQCPSKDAQSFLDDSPGFLFRSALVLGVLTTARIEEG
jgi:hypothetical protein